MLKIKFKIKRKLKPKSDPNSIIASTKLFKKLFKNYKMTKVKNIKDDLSKSFLTIKEVILNILGLNYYHPDSSAVLIKSGNIVAAVEEERFVRIKHFSGFPNKSIDYCLKEGGIKISDLDLVALNFKSNSNLKEKILYQLKTYIKLIL